MSAAARLPVRDLQRVQALIGEKDTVRVLAALLSRQEVADLLNVSLDLVGKLTRQGTLRPVRLGRTVRYRLLDVLAVLDRATSLWPAPEKNAGITNNTP